MKKFYILFTLTSFLIISLNFANGLQLEKISPKFKDGKFILETKNLLKKQPSSILNQAWDGSAWVDSSRSLFTYNSSGFMTSVTYENLVNGSWIIDGKSDITYDVNNNILLFTFLFYENGVLNYGSKTEYKYNGGNVSETISQIWDSVKTSWENASKDIYEYTGNNATRIAGYIWDEGTSDWQTYNESNITYDAQNREVEELNKIWDSDANAFINSSLTTTEYHSNGQISKQLSKNWDENTGNWSEGNYNLVEWEYDNNANLIRTTTTTSMDFGGFTFLFKDKTEFEYDANNYLISEIDFTWDTVGEVWNAVYKSDYSNDNDGNILEIIGQINDQMGGWANSDKSIFNYDPVSVKDENELPNEFSLSQNYPNPFNPSTIIDYTINKADHIQLIVYDVLGNVVSLLVNESQTPGNYSVRFDGSNLSSGIYIYTLRSGTKQISRSSLLLK